MLEIQLFLKGSKKRRANWIEIILHKNVKISIFQVCCVLCFINEGGTLPLLSLCQSAQGVPGGMHTFAPCSKAVIICHSHERHGLGVLALCIKMQKQDKPLVACCANKSKFLVKSLWCCWEKNLKWHYLNPKLGTLSCSGTASPLHGEVVAFLSVLFEDLLFDWSIDLLRTIISNHWEVIKDTIHETAIHFHPCNHFIRSVFLKRISTEIGDLGKYG